MSSLLDHGLVRETRDRIICCTRGKLYLDAIEITGGAKKKIDVVVIPKDFVVSVLQTVDFAKNLVNKSNSVHNSV